ncbi:hypothetical protein ACH4OQ_26345 [Streptomyces luteogriseus]|uniref:hypothetical protein n=1 Tax=Streptomyces luteogriseus TaxID=68233 RepID=UPI0037B8E383
MPINSDRAKPANNHEPSGGSHSSLWRRVPGVAGSLALALSALVTLAIITGQPIALIAQGIVAIIGAVAALATGNARK